MRLLHFGIILFIMAAPAPNYAQDLSDSSYFSSADRKSYPPYDSSELRYSRTTLYTGHVLHGIFTRYLYFDHFNRTLDLGLDDGQNVALGLLASTPTIIRALNKKPSATAIWMNHHGTNMGFYYGLAGSQVIMEDRELSDETLLTTGTLSSIGFGTLGYYLGKQRSWDDNQVSLYQHYGPLGAVTGLMTYGAVGTNSERELFLSSLIGAAGGYWYAHHKSKRTDLTRGDYVTTSVFSLYNAYFWGRALIYKPLVEDGTSVDPHLIPVPLLTTIGGSYLNQHWTRNSRLSRGQSKVLSSILVITPLIYEAVADYGEMTNQEFLLSLGAGYALGGIGYKLALDEIKSNNLERRSSTNKAHLSLSPFTPLTFREKSRNQSIDNSFGDIRPGLRFQLKF